MTTATHIITGITLGSVLAFTNSANPILEGKEIILLSTLIMVLPDFNIIKNRKLTTHHSDYSHYPITAFVLTAIVFLLETFVNTGFIFSQILFVELMAHYLMDTFGHTIGVHWFYPFDKREFSFTKLRGELKENNFLIRAIEGIRGPVMKSELVLWSTCLVILSDLYLN